MPKKLFSELDEHKREKITQVILNEFASKSYVQSSTNAIAENAQIAKGSLFKYFKNKENMYFYILDYVINDFTKDIAAEVSTLPADIFEQTIKYAEFEFNWHISNPQKYKLFKRAFEKNDSEIYKKTESRYQVKSQKIFDGIYSNQGKLYNNDISKIMNLLQWFLEGFNKNFMENLNGSENMEAIKKDYITQLKEYINLLKSGLILKEK